MKPEYPSRVWFRTDILAEYLPPVQKTKGAPKVIVLCDGMPTMPDKNELLRFLSQKGYHVFHPRYRGTWESYGVFMRDSPEKDIKTVLDGLVDGLHEALTCKKWSLVDPFVVLIGSSFGGAAALLSSRDPLVRRVIALSPVVDWRTESITSLERLTIEEFGSAYRIEPLNGWDRLAGGAFFNPIREADRIEGSKILIIHAKDDEIVLPMPVADFAKLTRAKLVMLKRGGHMGLNTVMRPSHWKRIQKFISESD